MELWLFLYKTSMLCISFTETTSALSEGRRCTCLVEEGTFPNNPRNLKTCICNFFSVHNIWCTILKPGQNGLHISLRLNDNVLGSHPTSNYMFKVNNRNTRTRCQIFKVNNKDTIGVVLVSLLLTLNISHLLLVFLLLTSSR